METIQIVIDPELRQAADEASKKRKVNRSALIREALRAHLKKLHIEELEEIERRAYEAHPDSAEEWEVWEREAVWPEK